MSLTFYTSFARAQNAHVLSVGRTKKRERERKRDGVVFVFLVLLLLFEEREV